MPDEAEQGAAPSDPEVIANVLKGDTSQFEILMRRHNQRLYRVARSIIGNAVEAEEVVQAAWSQAYVNLRQYAGAASFATWISTIAANEAFRRIRERARFGPLSSETQGSGSVQTRATPVVDPEQRAFHKEVRRALEAAIDSLPREYRSVFVLRCIERMNVRDTSEVLGVSEDVVKARLRRARLKLQQVLGKRLGTVPPDLYRFRGFRCDRVVAAVFASICR